MSTCVEKKKENGRGKMANRMMRGEEGKRVLGASGDGAMPKAARLLLLWIRRRPLEAPASIQCRSRLWWYKWARDGSKPLDLTTERASWSSWVGKWASLFQVEISGPWSMKETGSVKQRKGESIGSQ